MHKKWLIFALLVIPGLLLVACGTRAEAPRPTFEPTSTYDFSRQVLLADNDTDAAEGVPAVVAEPTTLAEEPTESPATATPEPTAIPATTAPTEVPATEAPEPTALPAGDVTNGSTLFLTQGCTSCHQQYSEAVVTGPGFLGLGERAGTRVEGQSAYEYLYNSIIHPNDYIVEGFSPNLMPQNFGDLLSEQQINDLIAYLLTL